MLLELRPFQPNSVFLAQLAFFTVMPFKCASTSPTCITSQYLWCMSNRLTLCDNGLRSKQHSSTSTT